jgi:hypothetical protein
MSMMRDELRAIRGNFTLVWKVEDTIRRAEDYIWMQEVELKQAYEALFACREYFEPDSGKEFGPYHPIHKINAALRAVVQERTDKP